ncbi:glycosyltransferase family 2 protein [Bdellovibrio bacteriovorus]|uniref:glycosyltransferase family 2 protein n=1 Tax=Bdellovibrio bacteriovorus TaxID=959 RepID=UPI0035A5A969
MSVCINTYNQEKYIGDCLQSFIDQEVDFPYEIIVGSDASTDGTRSVIERFQAKYPDKIVPIFHESNVGPVENVLSTYRMARGKYISHCDGDDKALPGKLAQQVAILDAHPDCIICSHDVQTINETGNLLQESFIRRAEGEYSLMDIYEKLPFFAHSSKMFVNDMESDYWHGFTKESLDIDIHVAQLKKGMGYHLDRPLGCYRVGVGITALRKGVNPLLPKACSRIYEDALKSFPENQALKKYYAKSMLEYAYRSAVFKDPVGLKEYAIKSLGIKYYSPIQLVVCAGAFYPSLTFYLVSVRVWLRKVLRALSI